MHAAAVVVEVHVQKHVRVALQKHLRRFRFQAVQVADVERQAEPFMRQAPAQLVELLHPREKHPRLRLEGDADPEGVRALADPREPVDETLP